LREIFATLLVVPVYRVHDVSHTVGTGKKVIVHPYLNVSNIAYGLACYSAQANLFEFGEIEIKQVGQFPIKQTEIDDQ
jgi:hypothetical protein